MILKNEGKEFKVRYAGVVLDVPKGKFEVEDSCARHILKKIKGKDHKVVIVEIKKKATIKKVTEITPMEALEKEAILEDENKKLIAEVKAENAKIEAEVKAEKKAKAEAKKAEAKKTK